MRSSSSSFEREYTRSEYIREFLRFLQKAVDRLCRRTFTVSQERKPEFAFITGFKGCGEVVGKISLAARGLAFDVISDDTRATSEELIPQPS